MTEITRYKGYVDIPFIEADLDGFDARRANLLEAITKELGPNDYKTNIKARMTKWNMHDYEDFKWLSDQALGLLWKYDRRGEGVWSCTSIWVLNILLMRLLSTMTITLHLGRLFFMLIVLQGLEPRGFH